jgi:hypothetical protein
MTSCPPSCFPHSSPTFLNKSYVRSPSLLSSVGDTVLWTWLRTPIKLPVCTVSPIPISTAEIPPQFSTAAILDSQPPSCNTRLHAGTGWGPGPKGAEGICPKTLIFTVAHTHPPTPITTASCLKFRPSMPPIHPNSFNKSLKYSASFNKHHRRKVAGYYCSATTKLNSKLSPEGN